MDDRYDDGDRAYDAWAEGAHGEIDWNFSPGDAQYEALADAADLARKRAREAGIPNPYVAAWEAEQALLAAEHGRCEHLIGQARCILPTDHAGGHYAISTRQERNAA